MMWLVLLLLMIASAGLAIYYLRGPMLGMLVTYAVKFGLRKKIKGFHLGSFNLLPFAMYDFQATLYATRKTPEGTVSWKSFRVLLDITKIFDPLLSLLHILTDSNDPNIPKRNKMISFVFEDFAVSSPGMTYALFLNPPENKLPPEIITNANGDRLIPDKSQNSSEPISYGLIIKRLMQHVVLFIDIVFINFSFHFQFPSHESKMIGKAERMTIYFPRSSNKTILDTITVMNQIDKGEMEILHQNQRAILYKGYCAQVSMDLHLPSGVMEVLMRIIGREHDQMFITIAPFLEFYRRYTIAEDNSVEIRLARGLSTGGRMTMKLQCEYIHIILYDIRCKEPLSFIMNELEGELKTYFLTRFNERIYKDMRYIDPDNIETTHNNTEHSHFYQYFLRHQAIEPIIMSPNKEKVMKGSVKRLDFHTNRIDSIAYIENINGIKVKRVYNENDYIDNDCMNGIAKYIHMERIYPELLDWLIVLQDTANRLPDSRFAHKKNSEMNFIADMFLFSTQPVSVLYVPPPVITPNPNRSTTTSHNNEGENMTELPSSDPPIDTLENIPVDSDHWVRFRFNRMEAKRELPHCEVDSLIDFKCAQFIIDTSQPQNDLQLQYSLAAIGEEDGDNCSDNSSSCSSHSNQDLGIVQDDRKFSSSSSSDDDYFEVEESQLDRDNFSFADVYNDGEPRRRRSSGSMGRNIFQSLHSHSSQHNNVPDRKELSGLAEVSKNIPGEPSLQQNHSTSCYTGSCWTFPSFTVRMKLGVKMHLEWVKAEHMQIEFLNSTEDLLHKGADNPPVRHPFFLSTTLSAIWYNGLSISSDLGAVQLHASVGGLLKAQSAYSMIRRTADRVSGRMTFIKLRGPPGADIKVTPPITQNQPSVAPLSNPKTTIRIDHFTIHVPVDITPEDHDKRLQHEIIREQRQIKRQQTLYNKIHSNTNHGTFSTEHSDVEDTTTPHSESIPSENFNPKNIDRSNKSLCFVIIAFEYTSSVGETIIELESCKTLLNAYPERPWMIMSSLRYSKRVLPMVSEDAFYQEFSVETSSIDTAKISEKSVMDISIESFQLFYSARMEFGLIIDSLLLQDAAFKLATKQKKRHPMYSSLNPIKEDNNNNEEIYKTDRNLRRQSSASTYNSNSLVDIDELSEELEVEETGQSEQAEEEFAVIFGEEEDELEDFAKPNPNTMHVQFDAFVIIYDAHYQNEYVEEFMTAEFLGFDLFLDATKSPSAVQDEITLLDMGGEDESKRCTTRSFTSSPITRQYRMNTTTADINSEDKEGEDLLVYGGVFGGQLRFGTKLFRLKVKPSTNPLLETEDMKFIGPMYNASVKDDRIPRYEMMVALSDSVPTYICGDRSSNNNNSNKSNSNNSSSERSPSSKHDRSKDEDEQERLVSPAHPLPVSIIGATEPLFIVLSRTAAPPKIYMDISMTGKIFQVSLDHATMGCVVAINAVTDCIVPPNKDPSPLLVLWDMWRYLLHGSFSFNFDKMSVQYSALDYLTQKVKLNMTMKHPQWYMEKGNYAITAVDIQMNADIQTTILTGRRRGPNRLNNKIKPPSVITSKLCHIPAFVLSLVHSRDDVREKISSRKPYETATSTDNISLLSQYTTATHSHHDVYLSPALADPSQFIDTVDIPLETYIYLNNDRYHYFRSRNMSIRWEIEVRFADEEDVPISVNVRLDHLVRILDALNNHPEDLELATEGQGEEELGDSLDMTSDYCYGVTRPLAPLSIADLISTLRVQLVLNKIIISSWHSQVNLGGFVMTIGSSDMQLRLNRDIPSELLYIPQDPGTPDSYYTSTTTRQKSKSRRSSLSPFNDSNTQYKDHSHSVKTQDLGIFPMKIDHFYLETAFIELYVRNWSKTTEKPLVPEPAVLTERKSLFSRPSISEGVPPTIETNQPVNSEPQSSEEIQALFLPIYKNAHSTKMIISLTESGEVCTKDSLFVRSGILEKISEKIINSRSSSGGVGMRTSRRLNSGNNLSGLLDSAGRDGDVVFLIGREWKEYLVRTAASNNNNSNSNINNIIASSTQDGMNSAVRGGRRMSALSMQLSEMKSHAVASSPSRRTSMTSLECSQTGRRSSLVRRSSLTSNASSRSRNHPRTESMASTNSGHSELLLNGQPPRVVSNRNRRSSIRAGYKPERAFTRPAQWDPVRDGYRASLLSFRTNHSAFTPPPSALPRSYGTTKAGFVQGRHHIQRVPDEETSFGTKIWGLRITDLRLLFTIEIRDIWFGYIIRGMDLFQASPTPIDNHHYTSNTTGKHHRPSSINLKKQHEKQKKENEKATIYDFLQTTAKKTSKIRSKRFSKDEKDDKFLNSPLRMLSPLQTSLDTSNDPMLQFLSTYKNNSSSPRSTKDFNQMLKIGGTSTIKMPINKSKFQKGGRELIRKNNIPIHYNHEQEENQGISARMALEMESSSEDEEEEEMELNIFSSSPIATAKPFQHNNYTTSCDVTNSNNNSNSNLHMKLPSDSTELPIAPVSIANKKNTSQKGLKEASSHIPSSHPTTTSASAAAAVSGGESKKTGGRPASIHAAAGAAKKPKKPLSEYFFIVELIDPQVNFLDVNTHSSLIIVAGLSSLEGKRYTDATLPPASVGSPYETSTRDSIGSPQARGSMSAVSPIPRRQQEIRLRMDGVSAFTVPSNCPDDDNLDLVHWKHMESTECIDPIGADGYIGRKRGSVATVESPFMRMAIKDFQIRALYIFWTDVTVKEAKKMYLIPSKDELVCTFKLELPVICVDILSWQFYVIMHVIRNVLLVPPPASVSRVYATQTEAEEAEKNKILELMRDPVLLAKHDIRANLNASLDLKHKHCRDELKLLIEENLAGAMMHMELGSARFVEVFVGSCTWILRMNSTTTATSSTTATPSNNSSSSWEKEQLKVELTGAHATFSYGEDRSASSLLEVQRFWAKDMDPGRDVVSIVKTQPATSSTLGLNPTQKPGSFINTGSGSGGNKEKENKDENKFDSIVIMPVLGQTEHCARCGAAFLLEENHATACTFHANQDGEPGEYKSMTVKDDLTGVLNTLQVWTCCGKHHAFAVGCSSRPHTCKEVMLQIRAEANPTTRVENIDLSVLKSVDISIFPNSTYDIQVHITKSLADVLHKYFSIDDMENYEITANVVEHPILEKEEKQQKSSWSKVKNVRKMIQKKRNKGGNGGSSNIEEGEDDMSVFSGGEDKSPGPGGSIAMYRTTSTPSHLTTTSTVMTPDATTTSTTHDAGGSISHTGKSTTFSSPWFSLTSKHSAAQQALNESSTHSDSTDSVNSKGKPRSRKSSFSLGSLFGKRDKTKSAASSDPLDLSSHTHTETAVTASAIEINRNQSVQSSNEMQSKQLKFNMLRGRTNSNIDRLDRKSLTGSSSHALQTSSDNIHDNNTNTLTSSSSTAIIHRRQEGVYVKFLRLGGIQLEVTTAGFILNVTKFKAQMDEFRCQGEVLQWKTLVFNMERHLAVSLFTNAASNSLSRFTNMFRFTGSANTDGNSTSVSDYTVARSKSSVWEGSEDPGHATTLKRSALGLPPSASHEQKTEENDTAKAMRLLGLGGSSSKSKGHK